MGAVLLTVSRFAVGGLFLYAGASKAMEPELFAQSILAYDVLPHSLVHVFAVVVPWIEVVCGILLLAGFWSRSAAMVTLGLLCSFSIAIGVNLYRGEDFSCGCFGVDGGGASLESAAVRVLVLTALTLVILTSRRLPLSLDRMIHTPAKGVLN